MEITYKWDGDDGTMISNARYLAVGRLWIAGLHELHRGGFEAYIFRIGSYHNPIKLGISLTIESAKKCIQAYYGKGAYLWK